MMYTEFLEEKSINLTSESDRKELQGFLERHGLEMDSDIEYSVALKYEDIIVATGSFSGKVLKCIAVNDEYKEIGLSAKVVTHLINEQYRRGRSNLFIYTKPENTGIFSALGFYPLAGVTDKVVLMENNRDGIRKYLQSLENETALFKAAASDTPAAAFTSAMSAASTTSATSVASAVSSTSGEAVSSANEVVHASGDKADRRTVPVSDVPVSAIPVSAVPVSVSASAASATPGEAAAIVVNCNPFTLGHKYLIEYAAAKCDVLHVFVVWEDRSLFPSETRYRLVKEGTGHLNNVVIHKGEDYIISNATFPSYFIKKYEERVETHARLDLEVFVRYIAPALMIKKRFVGKEPYCPVTSVYNEIMKQVLPSRGIEVEEVERLTSSGDAISASRVRGLIADGKMDEVKALVPDTTYAFLVSPEARGIIDKIRN